jgi:hypothetical protein
MIDIPMPPIIAPVWAKWIRCKNPPRVASRNPQIEPKTRIPMTTRKIPPDSDTVLVFLNASIFYLLRGTYC